MGYADEKTLEPLRNAIVEKPPFVSGVLPLPADLLKLFYLSGGDPRYVDLANATLAQLDALSASCAPAPFGLGNKDVFDETYRKAGKMDCSEFSTPLVPERTRLIDIIRDELLEGEESKKQIEIELYKLNVYPEGSFFKAHRDTPRSKHMFGSLVLVFPTSHAGGSLLLRHRGQEWSFDAATTLSTTAQDSDPQTPNIGFVMFFSDIEHEVSVVESGHRVTLTYNLYFNPATSKSADPEVPPIVPPQQALFKARLESLVADPNFLPDGGSLGFGLRHAYPFVNDDWVPKLLKGSDGAIQRVCEDLGLESTFVLLYEDGQYFNGEDYTVQVIVDEQPFVRFDDELEIPFADYVIDEYGGRVVSREKSLCLANGERTSRKVDEGIDEYVTWVTEPTSHTVVEEAYVVYGNQASLGGSYGQVCLIVAIPEAKERSVVGPAGK
ncbi:hypothetical protein DENSPDRAFT_710927 [Dentipellis sp. KUC8613]|nr:hypothetical protein DENSPDRAFT_710927 [Dentipellis sp. KUC8613]